MPSTAVTLVDSVFEIGVVEVDVIDVDIVDIVDIDVVDADVVDVNVVGVDVVDNGVELSCVWVLVEEVPNELGILDGSGIKDES